MAAPAASAQADVKKQWAHDRKKALTTRVPTDWKTRLSECIGSGMLEQETAQALDFLAGQLAEMHKRDPQDTIATDRSPPRVKELLQTNATVLCGGPLRRLNLQSRAFSNLHYKRIQYCFETLWQGRIELNLNLNFNHNLNLNLNHNLNLKFSLDVNLKFTRNVKFSIASSQGLRRA